MLGENFYGNSSINERMEPAKQQLAARHTGRQSTGSSSGGGGGAYY